MYVAKGERPTAERVRRNGEGRVAEWRKGDSGRVVPGNFTEWRNNVSYATFPEWRAVGDGVGGEGRGAACKYSPRARHEEWECNGEGGNSREKGGDAVTLWHAIRS